MSTASEVWIADASPIILLGKIGLPHLLTRMSAQLVIPQTVVGEINQAPPADLGRVALAAIIRNDNPVIEGAPSRPEVLAFGLDAGETAVLSATMSRAGSHADIVAVMDERSGRTAAAALGIQTLGTAGILIRAKDDGLIPLIVPYLHSLRAAGAWVSNTFCDSVARSVGETWP